MLEAILWPSKVISDQYKSEMFELKDGKVVSGVIVRENATNVFVRTADSPEQAGRRPEGGDRKSRGVDGLADARRLLEGMTQQEISNLLAFVLAPPPAK